MGYKIVEDDNEFANKKHERAEIEHSFIFAGFYICASPLKRDTASIIKKLQVANYVIKMITGDNILAAISIAKQLCLENKKTE